MCSATKS